MRRVLVLLCCLVVAACSSSSPSGPESFVSLASILGDGASANNSGLAPPTLFNTQMRSELEVPACASESKGHAHLAVQGDGSIQSTVTINNKGDESVRFGHIHHVNPASTTGPVIWWLSSPIGTDLNLTDRHLQFTQAAAYVSNAHFANHAAALAALLANPGEFYVNFHSDACTGGFARGFLP